VTDSNAHLSEWTLEQLAEGMLSEHEHQSAMAHVEGCTRCAAEMDAYRTLFTALAGLPRFAPSPDFSDAVIARVRLGPQPSPALERLRRWLPVTRRGWTILAGAMIVPALPVLGLVIWLLSQPMISAAALLEWGSRWGTDVTSAATTTILRWETQLGLTQLASALYAAVAGLPMAVVLAAGAALAVAIPLSVWSLVRLVRTPLGDVHYAN
jgi:hypothetical protein